jgi:hypothetical protein
MYNNNNNNTMTRFSERDVVSKCFITAGTLVIITTTVMIVITTLGAKRVV